MSAILGLSSTISEGNSANDTIRAINRQIDAQNSLARDNFNSLRQQEKENKQIASANMDEKKTGDRESEGEEGGKVLSAVNDLVAARNKGVEVANKLATAKPSSVDPENAPIDEGGNGLKNDKGETELVREKTDFDSDRLFTTEGAGYDMFGNRRFDTGISTGRPMPSGTEGSNFVIRAYPVNEGRPAGISEMIKPIEDGVNVVDRPSLSSAVSKIGTSGGGLSEGISGLLKGATILTGGYDAVKDIANPKSFDKLNSADKVSNVANIVSGGLESAGLALDATGVGAPLGAVIQGAGLISGAVGLGAGLIGDISGEKKQSAMVSKMPTISPQAQAPQQKNISYKSSFGGGQLVQ